MERSLSFTSTVVENESKTGGLLIAGKISTVIVMIDESAPPSFTLTLISSILFPPAW